MSIWSLTLDRLFACTGAWTRSPGWYENPKDQTQRKFYRSNTGVFSHDVLLSIFTSFQHTTHDTQDTRFSPPTPLCHSCHSPSLHLSGSPSQPLSPSQPFSPLSQLSYRPAVFSFDTLPRVF